MSDQAKGPDLDDDDDTSLEDIVDISDGEYRRIITELRASIDDIDESLSEALERGDDELPSSAREGTRRHRQAWKQFMALRKGRWG